MIKHWTEPTTRSVAEALVKMSDPSKVVAHYCITCGCIYTGKRSKNDAERCPGSKCTEWTCEDCSENSSPFQRYCSKCIDKRQTALEEKKLAEANDTISWRDYPDNQGVVWKNTYHQSIEDLDETCACECIEFPKRVWATAPKVFELDADDILSAAFEEWADESDVDPNYSGKDEFRKAVEAFNKANENLVLFWETNRVVDLTDYTIER